MSRIETEVNRLERIGTGIAVLVDGENVNTGPAEEVLRGVGGAAKAAVRRVYGNAQKLGKWGETPGFRLVHTHSAKNSADMRLCIDAVDLSHKGEIGSFVIVTSDGDYSHLAHHLRERHFRVIGVGETKTPKGFRAACSQFVEIPEDDPQLATPVAPPKNTQSVCSKLDELDQKIRAAITKHGNKNGLLIPRLNGLMHPQGVRISKLPERTWRAYLLKRPSLFSCDDKGPEARVRWVGPKR